jgi:hypothetical protein
MIRTQVQLTTEQDRRLRAIAGREGISLAEAVRRCIDGTLVSQAPSRSELYARAMELAGAFADPDGATDLSAEHDRYLEVTNE